MSNLGPSTAADLHERLNFVGGQWVEPTDGDRFQVTDPATGDVLAKVPSASGKDISLAIDAAADAFVSWSRLAAPDRRRCLRRVVDIAESRAESLANIITSENGKPLSEARAEVQYGIGFLDFAADEACRIYGESVPASSVAKRIYVSKQPVGVTAAIAPWNFPLAMITRKLGPALAAGCTQVIKPASETPLAALALAEICQEADLPAGVMNVLTGKGRVFGEAVLGDPRVRKVSFTGSTEIGRWLVQNSAPNLTRLSLELGGQAPAIILSDADLDVAVTGAVKAKFRNTGQSCIAANRFYVASEVYEEFCQRFASTVSLLSVGPGSDDRDIGPLIDDAAVAKVSQHVEDAISKGGKVLCGGRVRDMAPLMSRFYEPTVIRDASDDMLVFTEETFGPVAAVSPFEGEREAVERANNLPYGLAAYVFGRDGTKLLKIVEAIDAGVIGVNDGVPSTPQAPFGGMKLSGMGREGGKYVMDEYLETKYVSYAL